MEHQETNVIQRKVIIDVQHDNERQLKHRNGHNNKRRYKKRYFTSHEQTNKNVSIEIQPEVEPIPLELKPVITAAIEYGKKTHALGVLKAANTLKDIALKLSFLQEHSPEIVNIISVAEKESQKLFELFSTTYNGEEVEQQTHTY